MKKLLEIVAVRLEFARSNKVTLGLEVRVPIEMTLMGHVRQTTLDQLLHIPLSLFS